MELISSRGIIDRIRFIAGNLQLTPTAPVYLQFSPTNGAWHRFFSSKSKYIFTIAPDEVGHIYIQVSVLIIYALRQR